MPVLPSGPDPAGGGASSPWVCNASREPARAPQSLPPFLSPDPPSGGRCLPRHSLHGAALAAPGALCSGHSSGPALGVQGLHGSTEP